MLVGQSWWRSLPSEFCWPFPGPGGLAQEEYSVRGTGRSAWGMGSSSVKGESISGLVGNFST